MLQDILSSTSATGPKKDDIYSTLWFFVFEKIENPDHSQEEELPILTFGERTSSNSVLWSIVFFETPLDFKKAIYIDFLGKNYSFQQLSDRISKNLEDPTPTLYVNFKEFEFEGLAKFCEILNQQFQDWETRWFKNEKSRKQQIDKLLITYGIQKPKGTRGRKKKIETRSTVRNINLNIDAIDNTKETACPEDPPEISRAVGVLHERAVTTELLNVESSCVQSQSEPCEEIFTQKDPVNRDKLDPEIDRPLTPTSSPATLQNASVMKEHGLLNETEPFKMIDLSAIEDLEKDKNNLSEDKTLFRKSLFQALEEGILDNSVTLSNEFLESIKKFRSFLLEEEQEIGTLSTHNSTTDFETFQKEQGCLKERIEIEKANIWSWKCEKQQLQEKIFAIDKKRKESKQTLYLLEQELQKTNLKRQKFELEQEVHQLNKIKHQSLQEIAKDFESQLKLLGDFLTRVKRKQEELDLEEKQLKNLKRELIGAKSFLLPEFAKEYPVSFKQL